MATVGEAIVKFSSDATATLQAMQAVADGATQANEKSSTALETFKQKLSETVDASNQFTAAFLAGSAAVGAAAVAFSVKAIDAYNEFQGDSAAMDAALKSTSDAAGQSKQALLDNADALSKLSGATKESVMSAQDMLLTFTGIKGQTFPQATQATLDLATAMNNNMIPSASQLADTAKQLGKALNDPATGYSALKREGVDFTASQIDQIKTLTASGNVLAAQNIILKELSTEFGGRAAAAGATFAGQMAQVKNNVNDLMIAIGGFISGELAKLLTVFNKWFDAAGGVQGIMQKLTATVQEASTWFNEHRDIVVALAGAIAGPLVVSLIDATVSLVGFLVALAPALVIGAAVALTIYELYTNWQFFSKYVAEAQGVLEKIGSFISTTVWPVLNQFFTVIASLLGPAVKSLGDVIMQQLWPALQQLWNTIKPVVIPVLESLAALLGGLILTNIALVVAAFYVVVEALKTLISWVSQAINQFDNFVAGIEKIISGNYAAGFKEIATSMMDAFLSPFKAAFDFIQSGINGVFQAFQKIPAVSGITSALKSLHIPGFASGVENFEGGLAYVHQGEVLTNLPKGTDVIPKDKVNQALSNQGAQTTGPTYNITAQIGMYAGTPGELRTIAEKLGIEMQRLASAGRT